MGEENEQSIKTLVLLKNQISTLERDKKYKKEYHQRLVLDDEFAGRIAREKLGFSYTGETVFRFNDSTRYSGRGEAKNPAGNASAFDSKSFGTEGSSSSKSPFLTDVDDGKFFASEVRTVELESSQSVPGGISTDGAIKPEFRIDMTGAADTNIGEYPGRRPSSGSGAEAQYVPKPKSAGGGLIDAHGSEIGHLKLRTYVSKVRLRKRSSLPKNIRFRAQ